MLSPVTPPPVDVPRQTLPQRRREEEKKRLPLANPIGQQTLKSLKLKCSKINLRLSSTLSFGKAGKGKTDRLQDPWADKAENVELIRSLSQAGWQSEPLKPIRDVAPQLPTLTRTRTIVFEAPPIEETSVLSTPLDAGTVKARLQASFDRKDPRKKMRPKISLTIPEPRPLSFHTAERGHAQHRVKTSCIGRTTSPPSLRSQSRRGNLASQLRVVSPVSTVGAAKPQRTYIGTSNSVSVPDLRLAAHRDGSSSAASMDEHDDASSCYSVKTAVLSFETGQSKEGRESISWPEPETVEFSVICPAEAGVFDKSSPSPKVPALQQSRMTLSFPENKPLPPDPAVKVSPLMIAGKGSSTTARIAWPRDRNIREPSTAVSPTAPVQAKVDMSSLPIYHPSLSLYASDKALRKVSAKPLRPEPINPVSSPTLSEAVDALEGQLSTMSQSSSTTNLRASSNITRTRRASRNKVKSVTAPIPTNTDPELAPQPVPTALRPPPPIQTQSPQTPSPSSRLTPPPPYPHPQQPSPKAQVIDPADAGMHTLVMDMGFPEADAKRALADTDTGQAIDVHAAVEMLVQRKEQKARKGERERKHSNAKSVLGGGRSQKHELVRGGTKTSRETLRYGASEDWMWMLRGMSERWCG